MRHLLSIGDLEPRRRRADPRRGGGRTAGGDGRSRAPARQARAQPLLRVLHAHLVELRARREAARRGRAVAEGGRLVGRQGRVAQGHGADARAVRPGRDRRSATRRSARPRSSPATRTPHVVNAGDGKHQHPTQALLDLYTMREALGSLDGLHVAIVGDVLHCRVARSLIQALALVGAHVTLVGPPTLLPRGIEALGCETATEIEAIESADVVYVLRMQRERMESAYVPSLREYAARWGITPERLRPGQKVMHPGPMNRGVEIDGRVADAARLADPRPGARGSRRPDGRAVRPARRRRGGRARGGRMTLFCRNGRSDSLVARPARLARRRVRRRHHRPTA